MSGLQVPVGVTPNGGASVTSGDDQLIKIIMLGLSDVDTENPFATLTNLPLIFDINDPMAQPITRHRITSFFQRLEREGRAKLVDDSLEFISSEGDFEVAFQYINLKTKRPNRIKARYDPSGRFIT
jgi:hypothetical protein